MQDLTVTLEKIAKMQDWIVTNVTDILSATLLTNCPFASLACVIVPLTRTRTKNFRSDWWRSKCSAPAEGGSGTFRRHLPGRSRLQNANLVPGTTWRTFFPRCCQNQKCILHFWFSKAHFAPLNRRSNVKCKMHLTSSGFERQADARSCVLLLSPLP